MYKAAIGLNQQMFPVFLGLLFTAVIIWFYLSSRLYKMLKQSYPKIYGALENPRPYKAERGATSIRVVRFLIRRDYETAKDPALIRLCQGLRYIIVIYAISLGGSLLLLLDKMLQG